MKSVISDNKIIPFLPCYKRTSQLHETKVSDLKTVYGCNGYAVYDYIENNFKKFPKTKCKLSLIHI